MGDSVREMLWSLVEKVQDAEPESLSFVLILACAMTLLERRRESGGGRFGGAGASGKDWRGPQWVTPEEAVAEFGLDSRRLHRMWKRLDYCAPRLEGGRGFRVDRWALQAKRERGQAP